jgi:hypothetical protein
MPIFTGLRTTGDEETLQNLGFSAEINVSLKRIDVPGAEPAGCGRRGGVDGLDKMDILIRWVL